MLKLLWYVICAVVLYFIGNLIHERYVYISDRRAWLVEGESMACTNEDNTRLLAQLKSEVLDSFQQRVVTNNVTPRISEIQFEISPFGEQTLVGEPFGMGICTKGHFPWKQGKGGPNDASCSMPAYLSCSARVVVKVPADIKKEADLAARYVPLQQYGSSETVSVDGQSYELFSVNARFKKTVPRYSRSRLYMEDLSEGKALQEFDYNVADLKGVIENWLQFHENQEKIMRDYQIANDIGGTVTGGGYGGSISKMRREQIQPDAPPAGQ